MKTQIKKFLVYLLISTVLNLVSCTSRTSVNKEALYSRCDRGAVGSLTIATQNGAITIDEATCRIKSDTLIVAGINRTNSDSVNKVIKYTAAMADIEYVEIEEYDSGKTLGCIIGGSVVALGIFILLAAHSVGGDIKEAYSCKDMSR